MTFEIDSITDILFVIKWLCVNYIVVKSVEIEFVEKH